MNKKKLQLDQLDRKLDKYKMASKVTPPPSGWIRSIRLSLGMTLQQLADKLSITKQSVYELEKREKKGSITLKSLKEVANAMDLQLVYALVPKDGSLDLLIERKAQELAQRIVSRTSDNMKLEAQENSNERIEKAIHQRSITLKSEMPRVLWD
ncbi:MAG TPA: mobile mystery protein A [Membranihabitans sp.]|nr:mobile mystery protein A [Membranihabitans sp.]